MVGLALMGGLVFGLVKLLQGPSTNGHTRGVGSAHPSASAVSSPTGPATDTTAGPGGTTPPTAKAPPLKLGESITLAECKAYFDATRSGSESPELRELLDSAFPSEGKPQQNSRCAVSGSHACQSIQDVCKLLASTTERARTAARTTTPAWAQRLKLPSFGVRDDTSVKHVFDRYTINPSDHEAFQSMYFKCGSYQETIKTALTRYELPYEIMALVMVESACVPTIESPVGARGLFQLMPAAGRAYHLRVSEEIDERRNPTKATQAGIQYLADAYRKLGDWELTFASYNMGVYGVMARVERLKRAGIARPTYWDLRENDLLPQETANYVPMIEGFALILLNMRRLNFTEDQRPPIVTGDLEVWPGTRLGMIAHAAGTTVNEVRSLNPDILVPQIPVSITGKFVVQVPRDNVFRARDLYDTLFREHSETDLCVPETFDWGTQRFTPKMESDCRARGVRLTPTAAGTR